MLGVLAVLGAGVPVVAVAAGGHGVSAGLSRVSSGLPELTITRNGRVAYHAPVRSRVCGSLCVTFRLPHTRSALAIADLEGNGRLDVVLSLFSGGANCCFDDQVFSYDPGRGIYVKTEHDFANSDPSLERVGGRWVFAGSDARIANAGFTDYADSGAPVQILRFRRDRFQDVTRRYPARIRTDAARWLAAFHHHLSNGVGLIAAWAADEELLGQSALVRSSLATFAARHELRIPPGLQVRRQSQLQIAAAIERLLRRLHYTA